jgi:hypothetical protein
LNNTTAGGSFSNSLAAGTYTLTVYIGNRLDYSFSGAATIALQAGSVFDDSTTVNAPTAGTWVEATLTDVVSLGDPNIGQPLGILLSAQGTGGSQQVDFDDVSLSFTPLTATPLPAALPLFASGLGMLGLFGRRKRQKSPIDGVIGLRLVDS